MMATVAGMVIIVIAMITLGSIAAQMISHDDAMDVDRSDPFWYRTVPDYDCWQRLLQRQRPQLLIDDC